MKQLRLTALACVTALTFAACSKKENSTTAPTPNPSTSKTPKELIVGTWAIQSVTSNDPSNPDPLQACSKDDLMTVKGDGSCVVDAGTTKCDPTEPQTRTGTWKLDAYPTMELNTAGDTLQKTIKVTQLDETVLKMEFVYPQVSPTIFTYTWKRK